MNERDIEDHIARNPALIGPGLKLKGRQVNSEGRVDLIFEDQDDNWTVVELKLGRIGRDALNQLHRYMRELRTHTTKKVQGIVVCAGLMPAYEEELREQTKIRILVHGWDLKVQPC
jgi:RecB family endonuclease NucS